MSSAREIPAQAFYDRLSARGFMITGEKTNTSHIWQHCDTQLTIQVPFPIDGHFPEDLLIDLDRYIDQLAGQSAEWCQS